MKSLRIRRIVTLLLVAVMLAFGIADAELPGAEVPLSHQTESIRDVRRLLGELAVKGRAPKTGYERDQFGNGWDDSSGCDMRNRILRRDLRDIAVDEACQVVAGALTDPYTGAIIMFKRGAQTSAVVQIDHVVALSNAWQTGAQQLSFSQRVLFANDPLNLLAVDGEANQQKSDGDAATWLPANKPFRCQYVSRQVRVKAKYSLWVTPPEKAAIEHILSRCK